MIQLMGSLPFAPEPNRDVLRTLKAVDEKLDMRYLPIGAGCWALTEKWGDNDPRRERIRRNEMPPNMDFDVLGFIGDEMGAEDALAVLTAQLRQRADTKPEYQTMLTNCILQNAIQAKANVAGTREFAHEMLEASSVGNKVVSRGAGFSIEDGKVTGTPFEPKMGLTKSERDARVEWSDK